MKNLPIAVLGVFLIALVGVGVHAGTSYHDMQDGTVHRPSIESIAQSDIAPQTLGAHAYKRHSGWWLLIAWPEGVTTIAIVLTLFFIAWQAILMRQTVVASEGASKRELRAYLTVVIGPAVYQERRPADKGGDLKFDSKPLLVNTGRTPARKITFKARCAVMQIPLPKETDLPDSSDDGIVGNILGPQQNANMFAVADGFLPDDEVEDIKRGNGGKGLYVWGRITYEDVFGDRHFTQFCQQIYWDLKGNVLGHYIPGRNDAD